MSSFLSPVSSQQSARLDTSLLQEALEDDIDDTILIKILKDKTISDIEVQKQVIAYVQKKKISSSAIFSKFDTASPPLAVSNNCCKHVVRKIVC